MAAMRTDLPLVLLTDPIDPVEAQRFIGLATLRQISPASEEPTFLAATREASVIIVRTRLPDTVFHDAPRLRGVVRHGTGVDIIPVEDASRRGIPVANVPGANALSVAEYCLAAMLDAAKGLRRFHAGLTADGWEASRSHNDRLSELAGRRVGLVGLGAIGSRVADMCHAGFGMEVLGYRHRPDVAAPRPFVRLASLEEVVAASDYLCLACPLNDATRGLIDARVLDFAPRRQWIINVARAEVLDQDALLPRIAQGRIRGATLDVFRRDAAFIAASAHLPTLVLTPHLAGIAPESIARTSRGAVDAALRLLRGERPEHVVNPEVFATGSDRLKRPV